MLPLLPPPASTLQLNKSNLRPNSSIKFFQKFVWNFCFAVLYTLIFIQVNEDFLSWCIISSRDATVCRTTICRTTIHRTTIHRTTVYWNGSSSNRLFIEPTVYRTDSLSNDCLSNDILSNWQFIETTVYRTDSLSKRQFIEFFKTKYQHFKWTHAMRSSNFIIPIKSDSKAPMRRVYRILLNPITAF